MALLAAAGVTDRAPGSGQTIWKLRHTVAQLWNGCFVVFFVYERMLDEEGGRAAGKFRLYDRVGGDCFVRRLWVFMRRIVTPGGISRHPAHAKGIPGDRRGRNHGPAVSMLKWARSMLLWFRAMLPITAVRKGSSER